MATIGSLVAMLELNSVRFEQGLNNATSMAESAMKRVEGAANLAKAADFQLPEDETPYVLYDHKRARSYGKRAEARAKQEQRIRDAGQAYVNEIKQIREGIYLLRRTQPAQNSSQ